MRRIPEVSEIIMENIDKQSEQLKNPDSILSYLEHYQSQCITIFSKFTLETFVGLLNNFQQKILLALDTPSDFKSFIDNLFTEINNQDNTTNFQLIQSNFNRFEDELKNLQLTIPDHKFLTNVKNGENGALKVCSIKLREYLQVYFPHESYHMACMAAENFLVIFNHQIKNAEQIVKRSDIEQINISINELTNQIDSFVKNIEHLLNKHFEELKLSIHVIDEVQLAEQIKKQKIESESHEIRFKSIPTRWIEIEKHAINSLYLAIQLDTISAKTMHSLSDLRAEIKAFIDNVVESEINPFNIKLTKLIQDIEEQKLSTSLSDEISQFMIVVKSKFDAQNLLSNYQKRIESELIFNLEKFEVSSNSIAPTFHDVIHERIEIEPTSLIKRFAVEEIGFPLNRILNSLLQELDEFYSNFEGILKLVSFIGKKIDLSPHSNFEQLNFCKIQLSRINEISEKLIKSFAETHSAFSEIEENFSKKIEFQTFIKIAKNTELYQAKTIAKSNIRKSKGIFKRFAQFMRGQFYKLWYRQSDALLYARNIQNSEKFKPAMVDEFLKLNYAITPGSDTFKKIPFYYKELFLNKAISDIDFWYGRENELDKIDKTFRHYHAGFQGGILLIGEQDSGKTFFSEIIAQRFNSRKKPLYITAPAGGSVMLEIFENAIQNAVDKKNTIYEIFNELEENTVVIIDDLELWWEKSQSGMNIINHIIDLLQNFSHKLLFIINVNIHSYDIINKINKIDNYFLNIIECLPFNSETLKNIIQYRHQLSGLELYLNGKAEKDYNNPDFAKLFAKYFYYSHGYVGECLLAWIANIENADETKIWAKTPVNPSLRILNYLETDYLVTILQFILHKQLTLEKLERILLTDSRSVLNHINFLKRAGIVQSNENILSLNRYFYHHLKNKLIDMEII